MLTAMRSKQNKLRHWHGHDNDHQWQRSNNNSIALCLEKQNQAVSQCYYILQVHSYMYTVHLRKGEKHSIPQLFLGPRHPQYRSVTFLTLYLTLSNLHPVIRLEQIFFFASVCIILMYINIICLPFPTPPPSRGDWGGEQGYRQPMPPPPPPERKVSDASA